MGTSNDLLSYADVRAALDQALAAPKGIRISLDTPEAAMHLRHRLYKFRFLDRQASKKEWPSGYPQYGSSIYDVLTIENEGKALVIRQSLGAKTLRIEDLE